MKRITIVGLCLTAVCVASTVAATATAAALPEFSGPFPKAVTLSSKASTLETVTKVKVKCSADSGAGEVTEPKTLYLELTLTGCKKGTTACTNIAISRHYPSFLGYIDSLKDEVGIGFQGGAPSGQLLGLTECGTSRFGILAAPHGQIGKVTPVNKGVAAGSHFTLKFSQKEGKEKYTQLEGAPEAEGWFCGPFTEKECGFASSDEMTFAEEVKITT